LKRETDIVTQGYFSHDSPIGNKAWPFIKESGYDYNSAGENLGMDFTDSTKLYQAWANSPTHRANLINGKYRDMGIAILPGKTNGRNTYYVVQLFGEPKQTSQALIPTSNSSPASPTLETLFRKKPIQRNPLPSDKKYAFKLKRTA
jgi:hypothetical protein